MRESLDLRYYATAYVDLLGLSDRLRALEFVPDGDADRVVAAARESIGHIAHFRRAFRQLYDALDRPMEQPDWVPRDWKPTSDDIRILAELNASKIINQSFGDCIALSVPIDPGAPLRTWRGLFQIFAGVAMASLALLTRGQVCRGAIELGMGCEAYDDEVLGASVAKAYSIETRKARVPRVLVGPDLINLLRNMPWNAASEKERGLLKLQSHLVESLLATDTDGEVFLDFLGPLGRKFADESIINAAREFVEREARGAGRHAEKYEWLRRYFSSRIDSA